jgi:hypothetical protein
MKRKRHKALILLESLLDGEYFEDSGYNHLTYLIDQGRFGILGKRDKKNGMTEDVLLPFDMTVTQFIELAEQISDDDIFIIGANNALRKMKNV